MKTAFASLVWAARRGGARPAAWLALAWCFAGLLGRDCCAGQPSVRVAASTIGRTPDGSEVVQYVLTNASGLEVRVMTYGATLTSVQTPDREGRLRNITLHLDALDDYLRGHPLFGSVVGR